MNKPTRYKLKDCHENSGFSIRMLNNIPLRKNQWKVFDNPQPQLDQYMNLIDREVNFDKNEKKVEKVEENIQEIKSIKQEKKEEISNEEIKKVAKKIDSKINISNHNSSNEYFDELEIKPIELDIIDIEFATKQELIDILNEDYPKKFNDLHKKNRHELVKLYNNLKLQSL